MIRATIFLFQAESLVHGFVKKSRFPTAKKLMGKQPVPEQFTSGIAYFGKQTLQNASSTPSREFVSLNTHFLFTSGSNTGYYLRENADHFLRWFATRLHYSSIDAEPPCFQQKKLLRVAASQRFSNGDQGQRFVVCYWQLSRHSWNPWQHDLSVPGRCC